jgi:hypothetical protein
MDDNHKTCPTCAEHVKSAALICRYCRHDFRAESELRETSTPSPLDQPSTSGTLPVSARDNSGSTRRRVIVGIVSAVVIAIGIVAVQARGSEPTNVVRDYAAAVANGDLDGSCALLTAAGGEQIGSAAVGYLSVERGLDGDVVEVQRSIDLVNDLEAEYAAGNTCMAGSDVLFNPPFDTDRDLAAELVADGTSRIQDVDFVEDGDEATVSTDQGVWQLNEVGGRWLVSSVPLWSGLAGP